MNNMPRLPRLADTLGNLQNGSFLSRCMGIRVSRTHLLATGRHIDLSTLAQQAGYRIHVFIRREVFECLAKDNGQFYDDEAADLFALLNVMRKAMMKSPFHDCPVVFRFGVETLVANFGKVDHDDPRRAITVTLATVDND